MTAANTPQTPKSATRATNRPDVGPSASGALTEAEAENLCIGGWCHYLGHGTHTSECDEHIARVESLIAARVIAALAEVERRIEAWIRHGEQVPADVTTYERWIVHGELRALIRDYRQEDRR